MNSDKLFKLLLEMIKNDDLSFNVKKACIEAVLDDCKVLSLLGLDFMKIVDELIQFSADDSDETELMEIKLYAFLLLDYSEKYLVKNNIDIYKIFLEYLDKASHDYRHGRSISPKGIEVLEYFLDTMHSANDVLNIY